nr:hypothetical protein [Tanacetum cinerariifolium]
MLESYNDCINKECEKVQNEEDDLYNDVNINLERSNTEMTDAQANQDTEDSHVTLTLVPPVAQQQSSSVSSDLVSKFINPSPDTGIDSILNPIIKSETLVNVPVFVAAKTLSSDTTIPQLPIPNIQPLQQTPCFTTTTTIPTMTLQDIPNFASIFQFDKHISALETEISIGCGCSAINKQAQTENQEFLNQILNNKIKENKSINRLDIQKNLYNALVESYNSDKDIITSYGDVVTLKRCRDDQDKDEDPSAGSNRGSERRRSGKEAESSKEPTHKESKYISSLKGASRSQPKSLGKSAYAEEHGQKVDDLEDQTHQEFNTGNDDVTLIVDNRPPQPWITQMAQAAGTQSLFNEFLATPIDFFAFIMHQIKIDNMTQEVLTGPTYDLIKGTCESIVELEYHWEEVFKATNDRLDWHNPEGKPYPHDLSKPISLILNERGRQVIPLDHFINNDLEYLKGGSSSKKYITSISKTKVADYGQVKWIEDKGPKRQKFYGYASNMETSKDVYSRHKIIIVTSLKIMKNHLMRTDELHNFNDGTLNHVRTALNDIATGIEMDYFPKRK